MVIFPQINLNGSDPNRLLKQYEDAIEAGEKLLASLYALDVHGRDYQLDDNFKEAQLEHRNKIESIDNVLTDLKEVRINIINQVESRKRR